MIVNLLIGLRFHNHSSLLETCQLAYLPDPSVATGTAVVICPGGVFNFLSIELEGTEIARWLCARRVAAFVLKYRVARTAARDEDLIPSLN